MEQRYIAGDWVKHRGKLARIEETYRTNYFVKDYHDDYNPDIEYDDAYFFREVRPQDLVPIPLTFEILERNGWDKDGEYWSDFSLSEAFMGGDEDDEDNYTCFQLNYQDKKDGWVIEMRGELLKFGIHYVHELQHLFFGLGISHEMKV